MIHRKAIPGAKVMLLTGILAGGFLFSTALAQSAPPKRSDKPVIARNWLNRFPKRERSYYDLYWGVDSFAVKSVESGEIIQFSYRVLDPKKAGPLNDDKSKPLLIDPKAGVQLVVPSMERIGQLRQTAPPEAGRSYWMAFSNKGRLVKRGDRVTVAIGAFHIDGLEVR